MWVELWRNAGGIRLPEKVTEHQVTYCDAVEIIGQPKSSPIEYLLQAADRELKAGSRELNPWHLHFQEGYFRDLSFLTAGLFVGLSQAVQLKFSLVRDLLRSGDQTPLEQVIGRVPDLFDF